MNHDHNVTCKDLLGNISSYIDGELPDELCEQLRNHMAGCENCQVVFDTMTRTIYLYHSSVQDTEIPSDVRGRLFEALHLDDFLKPSE